MTDRERFVACVLGQPVDRPPYWLMWGGWASTWRRWQGEGMTFKDFGEVRRSFGAEEPPQPLAVYCGPCPNLGRQTIEETDEWYVFIDNWGIKRRNFKHHESMSEFIEFPVKDRRDWERYKADRLMFDHPDRLKGPWLAQAKKWIEKGWPIRLGYFPDVGIFGGLRWLLGDEECLLAFYDDPAMVHDIMNHLTDLYLAVFSRVIEAGVRVDMLHLWEDMCGRQGPLISPAHWERFMGPCYRRIARFTRDNRIPVFSVDTDGWPEPIIPPMMAAGVNYLWPFEVAAGCDVNAIRARFPTLGMMGGIDKRALAAGPEAIDADLARVAPAVAAGRYVPDLDHGIPDDVSWDNFRHYAARLKELVDKR